VDSSTRYADLFRSESREQLSAVNRALLDLEARPADAQPVHVLFRAVHSLKGLSASMGYAAVATFTHELESLLDRVRAGTMTVSAEVMDVLFAAADALEEGINLSVAGAADPPGLRRAQARLRALAGDSAEASPELDAVQTDDERVDDGPGLLVRVRQRSGIVFPGVRAFMVLQRARTLGELVAVSPPPEELQTAEISQAFAFRLVTPQSPAAIEAAIRSVGDVEHVRVSAGRGRQRAPMHLTPTDEPATAPTAARYVRIELSRLDRLVNLIGELVHTREQLAALVASRHEPALEESMARASRLIADLQSEVMASRVVPAWHLFDRFPRLVRDAARQLHKEIEFTIDGRDVEVDRFLLDEISEPVVHLLRNAVDHGIEPPVLREAAGKARSGRVVLSVAREQGTMCVCVRDDGRGIDRQRVLARARERGLAEPDVTALDDAALLRIIASPGFTLAPEVSDLSGRGVGFDVVQTRVSQLGGTVMLESVLGQGTTVTLRF
jgi:two-component system chemotaxis sensor kinase CheA